MDSLNYTIYEIDVADILGYESGWYDIEERDKTSTNELYEFLLQVLLHRIDPNMVMESLTISDYERGLKAKLKDKNELDECWVYFYKCYKNPIETRSFEVSLNNDNQIIFQKLFILKLRQYKEGLVYLDAFLNYQFRANFKNNLVKFRHYIDICLRQYKDNDSSIVESVNSWFKDVEKRGEGNQIDLSYSIPDQEYVNKESSIKIDASKNLKSEDNPTEVIDEKQTDRKPSRENPEHNQAEITTDESGTEEIVPQGYELVTGNFTRKETMDYFSFLYKEKSKGGQTFLHENDVIEIFKYGVAIPPAIPGKKYKLNCSLKFPKGIVEFCIHRFINFHGRSHQKKEVLKFFANYIVDFENALVDERSLQLWSNNVIGTRPKKMDFALNEYLPERMRDSSYSNPGTKNSKGNS